MLKKCVEIRSTSQPSACGPGTVDYGGANRVSTLSRCQSSSKQAHDALLHTLFSGRNFSQVAISPDGKRGRGARMETSASGKSAIYMFPPTAQGARPAVSLRAAPGSHLINSPTWSYDSSALPSSQTPAKPGQSQLYVSTSGAAPAASSQTRRILSPHQHGRLDGNGLPFSSRKTRGAPPGPLVAETAQTGVIRDGTEQRLRGGCRQAASWTDLPAGHVRL